MRLIERESHLAALHQYAKERDQLYGACYDNVVIGKSHRHCG
jgi:hypothetical protein